MGRDGCTFDKDQVLTVFHNEASLFVLQFEQIAFMNFHNVQKYQTSIKIDNWVKMHFHTLKYAKWFK